MKRKAEELGEKCDTIPRKREEQREGRGGGKRGGERGEDEGKGSGKSIMASGCGVVLGRLSYPGREEEKGE